MVDYSKWDKLEVSSSDESDAGDKQLPRVTKFDSGKRVTLERAALGDNVLTVEDAPLDDREKATKHDTLSKTAPAQPSESGATLNRVVTTEARPSVAEFVAKAIASGGGTAEYLWSQTADEVEAIIRLPKSRTVKGKDVTVSVWKAKDHVVPGSSDLEHPAGLNLQVKAFGQIILEGTFCHEVFVDEDQVFWQLVELACTETEKLITDRPTAAPAEPLDQQQSCSHLTVQFEPAAGASLQQQMLSSSDPGYSRGSGSIKGSSIAPALGAAVPTPIIPKEWIEEFQPPSGSRGLRLTLKKFCPVAGATIWWRSFLRGGPTVDDVRSLPARVADSKKIARDQSFRTIWDEAHRQFVDRVHNQQKLGPQIELNTPVFDNLQPATEP